MLSTLQRNPPSGSHHSPSRRVNSNTAQGTHREGQLLQLGPTGSTQGTPEWRCPVHGGCWPPAFLTCLLHQQQPGSCLTEWASRLVPAGLPCPFCPHQVLLDS